MKKTISKLFLLLKFIFSNYKIKLFNSRLDFHFKNIEKILKEVGEKVEGNLICDISPENNVSKRNISKIINIQNLCIGKKMICEIGVNAGHSLLLMLENNPNAIYLVFDLNKHRYTVPCLNYIRSQYPKTKIISIFGDSTKTVPEYIFDNPNEIHKYDLIHIDGGHDTEIVLSDFNSCKLLTANDGITIFDDYNYPNISNFIDEKISTNEIVPFITFGLLKTNLHFVYKFK